MAPPVPNGQQEAALFAWRRARAGASDPDAASTKGRTLDRRGTEGGAKDEAWGSAGEPLSERG